MNVKKCWTLSPTNQQLFSHFSLTSQNKTSKTCGELPVKLVRTHKRRSYRFLYKKVPVLVDQQGDQFGAYTRYSIEELIKAMNDRDIWRARVRKFRTINSIDSVTRVMQNSSNELNTLVSDSTKCETNYCIVARTT